MGSNFVSLRIAIALQPELSIVSLRTGSWLITSLIAIRPWRTYFTCKHLVHTPLPCSPLSPERFCVLLDRG
jgi:hypothetical protein